MNQGRRVEDPLRYTSHSDELGNGLGRNEEMHHLDQMDCPFVFIHTFTLMSWPARQKVLAFMPVRCLDYSFARHTHVQVETYFELVQVQGEVDLVYDQNCFDGGQPTVVDKSGIELQI